MSQQPILVSPSQSETTQTTPDIPLIARALVMIPAHGELATHSAEKVIGMALRHTFDGIDINTGRDLCARWDRMTGGNALSVFEQTNPNSPGQPQLLLKDLYRLARQSGWNGANKWPSPTPLPDNLPPVQPFEETLLPESLRGWVMDIAHRMQCPPDFPAVSALVALSSLVGARVVVTPKAMDTWQVVPNLWGMAIGRAGVKKSPAISEVLKPLTKLQNADEAACQLLLNDWLLDCQIAAIQREDIEKAARKLATSDPKAAKALLQQSVQTPPEPTARRYIVNDVTVEKLGELMKGNPWGLLSYRDELYGLLNDLNKQGQEGARAFMLQAYDGNQSYTFDRIGRGTIHIPLVCLALIGGIQPGRVHEYVKDAVSGGNSDDGLLQRFGLAVWPDISGHAVHVDQKPDMAAIKVALTVFERLAAIRPLTDKAAQVWRFSDDAQLLFNQWLGTLETELRSDELHPALISHLSKYRKLIPALALLYALIDTPDSGGIIQRPELERAVVMSEYLRSHAHRLYATAISPKTKGAADLLAKLQSGKLTNRGGTALRKFTPREIAVKNWAGLNTPALVREAAEVLADYDFLRRETSSSDTKGGRPSDRYLINPELLLDVYFGTTIVNQKI